MSEKKKHARVVFGRVVAEDSDGQRWRFELTKAGLVVRRYRARRKSAKLFAFPDLAELTKFTHSEAVARAKSAAEAARKEDRRQLDFAALLEQPEPQLRQEEMFV
jgi:hypothetical protein